MTVGSLMRTGGICIVVAVTLLWGCSGQSDPNPKEALRAVEAHPFQGNVVRGAIQSLQQAARQQPNDPWVYLGLARASLVVGYHSGSWFEARNFDPKSLEYARKAVNYALSLDSQLSRAYVMSAHLQILAGNYRDAWTTLNQAHRLAPESFYPWYLLGVLNRYYKLYDDARKYLRRAFASSTRDYQKRWVLDARERIAHDMGDVTAQERIYKQAIGLFPGRAWGYGNYGAFLLGQGRYGEAISKLEKALSIHSYPLAKRLLQKAHRLADESHKAATD